MVCVPTASHMELTCVHKCGQSIHICIVVEFTDGRCTKKIVRLRACLHVRTSLLSQRAKK